MNKYPNYRCSIKWTVLKIILPAPKSLQYSNTQLPKLPHHFHCLSHSQDKNTHLKEQSYQWLQLSSINKPLLSSINKTKLQPNLLINNEAYLIRIMYSAKIIHNHLHKHKQLQPCATTFKKTICMLCQYKCKIEQEEKVVWEALRRKSFLVNWWPW